MASGSLTWVAKAPSSSLLRHSVLQRGCQNGECACFFTQNHTTHKPDLGQGLKGGSGSGLVSGGSTGGLEILALLDIPAAQRGCVCVCCLLPDTRIGVGDVWCLASSGAVWRCLEHHSLHPPLCIQLPCHRVRDVGGWADSTPLRLVWAIWATMPRCLDVVWDGLFSVSHEH